MDNDYPGFERPFQGGLRLSSDEHLAREKAEEAERASYRRRYWQKYARTVKRVFGTVSPQEYRAIKTRADAEGRSVWAQIWAEAQAYRQQEFLPNAEIESGQRQLLGELDRVNLSIPE